MSEMKAKVEVKLTPKIFKAINIFTSVLIIFTNILRYFERAPDKEGIDGCPLMIFFIQTILTMMHAVFIICGEIMFPL